ncbi:GIY-YIG_nuclease family protein [Hexamita inflata]|uniref:GIY-YIG_nuclease family protein n=1 Tax=Hexamita inflata TaxID=28002 RepID=A0ABP1GWV6_9EUKA
MQEINFNETKLNDINDILGMTTYKDLEIVFNKEDNYICCSALVQQLKPDAKLINFINLNSIKLQTDLYYQMSKAQVHTKGQYSGYYIHQSLLEDFLKWLSKRNLIKDTKQNKGFVYCFSNPCLQNIYKIGYTQKSIEERLDHLYNTSIPMPYKCEFYLETDYAFEIEQQIHQQLSQYRINSDREFFKCDIEIIEKCFESI